jgi:hypothetical protein
MTMFAFGSSFPVMLGNVGRGYQVTAPSSAAPYHAAIAGVALTVAFVTAGFWLLRKSTLSRQSGRLALWVIAGSVSIVWGAGWLWHRNGHGLVYWGPFWDLAPSLPSLWVGIFIALAFIWSIRKLVGPELENAEAKAFPLDPMAPTHGISGTESAPLNSP